MDKPHCIINPKTNRAVKATSALGKKLLKDLENGNKSVVEAQKPVVKKTVVKTEVKKPVIKKTVAKPEYSKNIIEPKPPDSIFNRMKIFINTYSASNLYKKGLDAGVFTDTRKTLDFYKEIGLKYEDEKNELKRILKPWTDYPGWKQDNPILKWSKDEQDLYDKWSFLTRLVITKNMASNALSTYRRNKEKLKKKNDFSKPVVKTDVGLKELVDEWDTSSVGILFFQLSQKIESFKNIIKKTEDLSKKNKVVVPSDLFSFNPNLLNDLVDQYGATKKGIDIIDEGMRNIVKYINEDAKFPSEIDYKYFTKYMNGINKNKFSFLTTDKVKK